MNEPITDCCSAQFLGEIVDGSGRCSDCKEMAGVAEEDASE